MAINLTAPIVLAGAGKMGSALLAGWLARGIDPRLVIVQEPHLSPEAEALISTRGVTVKPALERIDQPPAAIVVAVKPQAMDVAFPPLARLAGPKTVVLSIAAGKSIASFEAHLPAGAAVVRAMPNTPAAIGRGISGAVASANVDASQKSLCDALLTAVGEVVWLVDEGQMDAVTAVSGSGPAYVFLLVECLADAGVSAGLEREAAMRLARATVSGAGALLDAAPEAAATLRGNVTSPGGTTAAALAVLMRDGDGLRELMAEAVQAGRRRGRELGR